MHSHPRSYSWRVLFDSISPFFLYLSFLPFSVFFLYPELFLELDNPIVMASLRYSAAEESEDTLNSFTSPTEIRWPEGWGSQGMSKTGGGGPPRVPNLRVCKHFSTPGDTCREKGRINVLRWYLPVGVAIPSVSRKGGRTGLPARVSGRQVVRRRQSSPIPAQASRNRWR